MDLWKALAHLHPHARPMVDYVLMDNSDGNGPFIAEWRLTDPQPTKQQLTDAIAAYDAAQTQKANEAATTRQQVRQQAQSAAGKSIDALNAADVRALLVVLLHHAGAIDSAGRVRALSEWSA